MPNSKPYTDFASLIKEARLAKGWTVTEAARRCKIPHQTLSYLESGKSQPLWSKNVISLSKLYRIPLLDLYRALGWDSSPPATFGAAIRQARKAKGWGLKHVAEHIGISARNLCDFEKGYRFPPLQKHELVKQIADKLELKSDWLYYLLGVYPADIRRKNLSPDAVVAAMDQLRNS